MKRKKTILAKNISRLVKLIRKSDIPSEKFVDSLNNNALNELDQPQQNRQRIERNTIMKLTLKKALAPAAVLIIAAGVFSLLKTNSPDQQSEYAETNKPVESTIVAGMAPIPLELPAAQVQGTRQPTNVDNLLKPLGHSRYPFMAPVGTVNVAAGKPVTSSDAFPIIGELEYITDGDKEASEGSFVELGPGRQQVTIDLGAKYNIYAIVVWHYHKEEGRVYFDVIAQIANDAGFTTNVVTLFNNDNDNSAAQGIGKDMLYGESNEGKLIDAKGVQARYVRMYSNGNNRNDFNHYIEIAVYGKPIED
jgi:hypothetical protein